MRSILSLIEKDRNTKKKMIFVFLVLSVFVVALIIGFLIRPAYSAVNNADCGITEHTHTSKCYSEHGNCGESVLVCSSDLSPEMLSHTHDSFCYDENGRIICPLPEYQHVHTDDCYDEDGVQICGAAYHQHGEECFRILGENDSASVLECGMEYHVHTESCYPSISSAPSEETQEDFAEAPDIEPYFEEAYELDEPEAEIYEPETDDQIALFSDSY